MSGGTATGLRFVGLMFPLFQDVFDRPGLKILKFHNRDLLFLLFHYQIDITYGPEISVDSARFRPYI